MAQKEQIIEEVISLEDLQNSDVGGNAVQTLYADAVTKPCIYTVKEAVGIKTQWGIRVDYTIIDDYAEWRISSWNIIMKEKIKALDLIGKKIELVQSKINDKKISLKVLD